MTKQTPPTWERPDLASVPLFTAFGDVTSDAGRPGRVRSAFSLPSSAVPAATSSLHVVGREAQERPSSLSTGAPAPSPSRRWPTRPPGRNSGGR